MDKSKFEKSVEDALNLPVESKPLVEIMPAKEVDENVNKDFDTARNNLHQIIDKGTDALDEALLLAKSSEHPRAFEVVGQLIKTLVDANKDLLDLQKKRKELTKEDSPDDNKTITQNNSIFVGSTAELQALLKKE